MKPSTKPCPGCGAKGKYRRAEKVCSDCAELIREAKTRRAQLARLKETEPAKLPFAPHCLPNIPLFSNFGDDPKASVHGFVFDIVHLLGQEVGWQQALQNATMNDHGYIISGPSGCDSGGSTYWLLPRGLKKLLNSLHEAVVQGSTLAYERGQEEGRSLIVGLATGDVSIDEFNKASIGKLANKPRRKRR